MKKINLDPVSIVIIALALLLYAGCGQYEHRKEQKIIEQERRQEEKAVSDLSDAVKVTTEAGWDSAAAYIQFCDMAKQQFSANERAIANFKIKVKEGHKIPVRYRARIRKLEQRNNELKQRLAVYKLTTEADWEDFTRLYQYDLQRLDKDIRKGINH